MKGWLIFGVVSIVGGHLLAEVVGRRVEYRDGKTALEGYVAFDDSNSYKRGGVLVFPDWMGPGEFSKNRADDLARLGYVALVADIYGKGVRPADSKEAAAQSTIYKLNRPLMRQRAEAALKALIQQPQADSAKVAAIGYCFGGTVALELARAGANLKGVVSFHGGLDTPTPQDAKKIKGSVLVLHGADDPYVPPAQVANFESEMREGGVRWEFIKYGGAVHSFSLPAAGNDPSKGAAYHPTAAKRSWKAMQDFLEDVIK